MSASPDAEVSSPFREILPHPPTPPPSRTSPAGRGTPCIQDRGDVRRRRGCPCDRSSACRRRPASACSHTTPPAGRRKGQPSSATSDCLISGGRSSMLTCPSSASSTSRSSTFASSRTLPGQPCSIRERSTAGGSGDISIPCRVDACSRKAAASSGDILHALPQRRQLDGHHVEPVVQILAEAAISDQRQQILVRGRDHPHVTRHLAAAADAREAPLLQHTQHGGLQWQRHRRDLVEKDRAPRPPPRSAPRGGDGRL